MIEFLRVAASSLVAKLLLGLLALSFVAWGVGDVLRSASGSTVAEVGGRSISISAYSRAFNDALGSLASRGISREQARTLQVDQLVLRDLIANAALSEEADEIGVGAPDEAVVEQLRQTPAFQNASGAFQNEIYELWLNRSNRRKRDYEAELRDEIARGLLASGVAEGGSVSRIIAEIIWKRRNERRDLDFVTLDIAKLAEPTEPTDAQITAFHSDEAERFTAPEYREIAYLWVRAADHADAESVSDGEIRALYDERADSYNKPERRNLEQIVFDDEAASATARQRIDDGESFAKIAADAGYGENDTALGYVAKADLENFAPELAEAAFGLRSDGVIGPIETGAGWTLINIAGVSPAEQTAFDDVREELIQELAVERAKIELPAVANAVEDLRAAGATFEEVGEKEKVTVGVVTVDQNGLTPDGERAEGLPADPSLLSRAFAMEIGEEMDLAESAGGEYFAVEVRAVTPSALKPLDTVRDEVAEAWRTTQRREALESQAKALLERLKAGEAIAAIASEAGAEVGRAEGLSRGAAHPELPTDLIVDMFATDADKAEGAAFDAQAEGGKRWVLAQVAAVQLADPTEGAAEIDSMVEGEGQNISRDMLQLYRGAALETHGVEVNAATIEAMFREGGGY